MDENKDLEGKKPEEKIEEPRTEEVTNEKETKGFGITAMVLGIISIILFCVPYISVPCAILSIIFGIIGIKKLGKGMAITGLVLGIITIVIYIIGILGLASFFASDGPNTILNSIEGMVNELGDNQII